MRSEALQTAHTAMRIADLARSRIPESHGKPGEGANLSKLNRGLLRRVQFVAAQKDDRTKKIYPAEPAHLRHSTGKSVLTPPEIFLEFVQASD